MSLIKDWTQPSAQLAKGQVVISALDALAVEWLYLHTLTTSWAILQELPWDPSERYLEFFLQWND